MKQSKIKLPDKLGINDKVFFENKDGSLSLLSTSHKHRFIGEITFEKLDLNGNVLFRTGPEYNDIVMIGATYTLEKLFGTKANLSISSLSEDMTINNSQLPSISTLPNEIIVGFMVGIGGSGETIGDVHAVNYTDKTVPTWVPFRITSTALGVTDASSYFMVKNANNVYTYYCKKFSSAPVISHIFTDGSEVPASICNTGTTKGIKVYAEMVCEISSLDIREYFMATYGSIDQCRINSIGLVAGFPLNNDYGGVRLITTSNFRSRYINNNSDGIRMIYRVYCV